jgi:hypothetical protein
MGFTPTTPLQQFGQDSQYPSYGPYMPRKGKPEIPTTIKNYSESQIVSFINDRIWGAVQAKPFQQMVDNMPKLWRAYQGIFKNQNMPKWRSQLYVRLSFKVVEVLRAYFQDAFFAHQPYIMVDGSMPEYVAGAKNLQKLFDYEMYHTKVEMRMMDVFNMILKFGTAVTKTYWRFYVDYQHTADYTRKGKFDWKNTQKNGKPYIRWDDPWFMSLDPRKVYPDPLARYTDELRYVIEESTSDLDQLYKDKERYGLFNLDYLRNEMPGYSQFGKRYDMLNDIYPRNQWNSLLDRSRRQVFLSEYWGRLDLPGNQDDPRMYCVIVANNRHIIKFAPSSYAHGALPYQFWNMMPQEETIYGTGAIEPVLTDNYILNALVNLRVDAMQYFLNPRILINRGALADRHSIEWARPGEMIPVNSSGDLGKTHQQLEIRDTGLQYFDNQLNYHMRHAEETMAVNPNAAGMLAQDKRSATESSMAMSGANARFNAFVKYIKWSGMDDMVRQYGQLMQQYIDVKHFPIVNPTESAEAAKIMQVTQQDICGEMFYRVLDSTQTNKDIRQQLITNLLGVLAPYAQAVPGMTIAPLLQGLLELSPVAGELNIKEIFSKMQAPPAQFNQESRSLEQLGAEGAPGMTGQGGPALPTAGLNPAIQTMSEQQPGGLF